MTPRQRQAAALAEIEHAHAALTHDLLLMLLSLDVILAEARDALGGVADDDEQRVVVVRVGG